MEPKAGEEKRFEGTPTPIPTTTEWSDDFAASDDLLRSPWVAMVEAVSSVSSDCRLRVCNGELVKGLVLHQSDECPQQARMGSRKGVYQCLKLLSQQFQLYWLMFDKCPPQQ